MMRRKTHIPRPESATVQLRDTPDTRVAPGTDRPRELSWLNA
jgi:hypothetical protein